MGKKRFHPYGESGSLVTARPLTSDTITVVGRREAPATEDEWRPLRPAKTQRMTMSKFRALQKRDRARDEEMIKTQLTSAQQADLQAFQRDIAGGSFTPPTETDYSFLGLTSQDNAPEEAEYGDAEFAEDEAAAAEALGLPPVSSEWANRLAGEHMAWLEQLPLLCDAYLAFRSGAEPPNAAQGGQNVPILCLDINSETNRSYCHLETDPSINIALARCGYLGSSPSQPKLAISLQLLELFANVQRRGPSVSVQILAKAWCDSRNVPYTRHFRSQLTTALDAFHLIRREVQRRLDVALGRDSPNWRMLNTCKACTYKLENEPPLRYSMLVTCDGNDSLKRCANAGTADHRHYVSDYYITPAEVNRFQNEVPSRRAQKQTEEDKTSACEKRWKNANVDNRAGGDKPKTIFQETGVFIAACRHSFILTACDMVQSGEQAKYGLATIDKLISVLGSDVMMGYDIGCTFKGTTARSAIVGPRAKEAQFDMCVGSFHGPAHNRACQLDNHPHNKPGTGLTDFENCETIFSSSNRIASTTRLASAYHRHQKFDIHLDGWDDDQYSGLGYLLRTKYINALKVLELAEASIAMISPAASASDFERYFQEERIYLNSLGSEPAEDTFAIEYIDQLDQLNAKQAEYDRSNATFLPSDSSSTSNLRVATLLTSRLESRRRTTLQQLLLLQEAVARIEDNHEIVQRWTPETDEWKQADRLRRRRSFQRCLDDLERLVVQRLLELSKAGLANTGYKMRTHIMKSLIARSAAIKSALTRYNQAASQLYGATAQKLTWEMIANVSILADIELLRGSRQQILEKDWAKPENRRCVEHWHRVQRAEEEIARLNIEVRRVHTSITDEQSLAATAARIQQDDPLLGWAANYYVSRRLKVNKLVLHQLNLIQALPGYTGSRDTGVRLGSCPVNVQLSSTPVAPLISLASDPTADPLADPAPNSAATEHYEHDDETSDEFARWQSVLDTAEDMRSHEDTRGIGNAGSNEDV